MKTTLFSSSKRSILLLMLFFTLALGQHLQAQDETRTVYFEINFLKTNNDDFMKVQDEIMKPYFTERMKQGSMNAWVLFRVVYPHSDNLEYNYVAIEVYGSFEHLQMGKEYTIATVSKVFPDTDISTVRERLNAAADLANSQVFKLVSEAIPGPPAPGQMPEYVMANYMKVAQGNAADYVKMEQDIFKPVHQAKCEAGRMTDWLLLQRIMPYGSDWDNDYMTIDSYPDFASIGKPDPEGLWKSVHGEKYADFDGSQVAAARDLRRSECWEFVDILTATEVNAEPAGSN